MKTSPHPDTVSAEPVDEGAAMRTSVVASGWRFLEQRPEAYREPVRLAELEGLPLAKVARWLGRSLTAVKSRVRRERIMLKKKLQDCCGSSSPAWARSSAGSGATPGPADGRRPSRSAH